MAQGFNMGRYVPPELEGIQSFNQASGKGHALGARARKLKTEGVLVVRFECPFAIWCTNCQPEQIIGQGVRFNAEKKQVGKYYTTPIWSFRFKHTVCGKAIEVHTDPKNAEYVVTEGGRKRDTGENKLLDGEVRIGVSEEDKDRLEKEGGFGALEKKIEDKKAHDTQQKRIDELTKRSDRDWADPYEMNRTLRREFRAGRRQRQADAKSGEALQEKFGIDFDLLAPVQEDSERAGYIQFGQATESILNTKPLFVIESARPVVNSEKKTKDKTALSRSSLQTSLQSNSRNAVDPFLNQLWQPRTKRKRTEDDTGKVDGDASSVKAKTGMLVGYGSDSDSS